jgi:hypothetical protein
MPEELAEEEITLLGPAVPVLKLIEVEVAGSGSLLEYGVAVAWLHVVVFR